MSLKKAAAIAGISLATILGINCAIGIRFSVSPLDEAVRAYTSKDYAANLNDFVKKINVNTIFLGPF
ncbi:MAG: hypothetical protein KKF46_02085 [Nanoarchaeota archaeon]|nr:hypothetical protein [Nanoarchaeota archaeon]MBU1321123.1 hypothetical protein [Nanoarchaeota archaeon]MBU1597505.1 hypothetical protein [Nanoarchaeota archaeon]MBU2442173.1 hypothetical protein [Nanoarchaeota archaeon]